MKRDRAEYMREYRRRQQMARVVITKPDEHSVQRIAELEEEVARLKRELALRRGVEELVESHGPALDRLAGQRTAQAKRDEILRAINKGK